MDISVAEGRDSRSSLFAASTAKRGAWMGKGDALISAAWFPDVLCRSASTCSLWGNLSLCHPNLDELVQGEIIWPV